MRNLSVILGVSLALGLVGCNSSDREKAKEEAREDVRKTTDAAKDLSYKVDAAVQPDAKSASDKMSEAADQTKDAAAKAGLKLDHAALITKVKAKLASEAGLSTVANIDVAAVGSVVTLSGTVSSDSQKKSAETAAYLVEGVTKVENHLTVQQ